mgnify:FL=1
MKEILRIGLPEVKPNATSQDQTPVIEFDRVDKIYNGQVALKNIDLKIYPEEFVCLVGQSGVGKTTLITEEIKGKRGES